jgi:anti-sigma regulatory factor (Ser/Thr protein kinase)
MSGGGPKPALAPQRRELDLAGHGSGAIGRSRRFVGEALAQWLESAVGEAADPAEAGRIRDQFVQDMQILVSEVVTNACVHTGGPLGLLVDCAPERLRIEVTDSSSVAPVPREPGQGEPGGYGLLVAQRLARSWGSEPHGEGKAVWLEVDWPQWSTSA